MPFAGQSATWSTLPFSPLSQGWCSEFATEASPWPKQDCCQLFVQTIAELYVCMAFMLDPEKSDSTSFSQCF